jgi:hypothetical protein
LRQKLAILLTEVICPLSVYQGIVGGDIEKGFVLKFGNGR